MTFRKSPIRLWAWPALILLLILPAGCVSTSFPLPAGDNATLLVIRCTAVRSAGSSPHESGQHPYKYQLIADGRALSDPFFLPRNTLYLTGLPAGEYRLEMINEIKWRIDAVRWKELVDVPFRLEAGHYTVLDVAITSTIYNDRDSQKTRITLLDEADRQAFLEALDREGLNEYWTLLE